MTAAEPAQPHPVLEVNYLTKTFPIKGRRQTFLTAVEDLNLTIAPGETVALVGESGSGKSTAARCIVQLLDVTDGVVSVNGERISAPARARKEKVHKDIQMVFQDPYASLNPRHTVRRILAEPLTNYFRLTAAARQARVTELLASVELDESLLDRRPRQLSGGQRQRLGIARALAVEPRIIVLDEPTASLDVSTRGQLLALLNRIQRQAKIAFLLISHDLAVVRTVSDRVLVMYLGAILESGPTKSVFDDPRHPYTRALLGAAPTASYRSPRSEWKLHGEIPSPIDRPAGCLVVNRCPVARPECSANRPELRLIDERHLTACPFTEDTEPTEVTAHHAPQ